MNDITTTQGTLTDRLISTATNAILNDEIMVTSNPDSWLRAVVVDIQRQIAAELIAHEEAARRRLLLQDAVIFILKEVQE